MTEGVLAQAVVYLAAAVIFVPLAKRLGLGAVLGYLVGGVVIGPDVLDLIGGGQHHVMHFAEFGVVMMLFLVGLELRPGLLWELRKPILGLGAGQVLVTAGAALAIGLASGARWQPALALGLTVAMSSTAIALTSLDEQRLRKTPGGEASFAVLLFQDVAAIGILALFPLLGPTSDDPSDPGRPTWLAALLTVGAVAAIIAAGRFVIRPLFRALDRANVRETYTAAALLLVTGTAMLMEQVHLSPALGSFLAGVVLADSEHKHELERELEPFKGLLLGLFFISVGAQLDFQAIAAHPFAIGGILAGTMALKVVVLSILGRMFGLARGDRAILAVALAPIGELAFLLLGLGVEFEIFDAQTRGWFVAAVALSMALAPLGFLVVGRRATVA